MSAAPGEGSVQIGILALLTAASQASGRYLGCGSKSDDFGRMTIEDGRPIAVGWPLRVDCDATGPGLC